MSYLSRVQNYRQEAENDYHQMGARPNVFGDQNYQYQGGATDVLDPNDRTMTISVVNAATTAQTSNVRIFGSFYDLTDANLNSNVTVTVAESSHLQVKSELLRGAYRIQGLKYSVSSSATQFSNVLSIYSRNSTGALDRRLWQPLNYRSAQNQITTQIDAPTFELLLTPFVYMEFTINASETCTFTFTIVEKLSTDNIMMGRNVIKQSRFGAPTGLPQIDLKNPRTV
jgi:hypothetical protein